MRYMKDVNEWLERDVRNRREEFRDVFQTVQDLRRQIRGMRKKGRSNRDRDTRRTEEVRRTPSSRTRPETTMRMDTIFQWYSSAYNACWPTTTAMDSCTCADSALSTTTGHLWLVTPPLEQVDLGYRSSRLLLPPRECKYSLRSSYFLRLVVHGFLLVKPQPSPHTRAFIL